MKAVKCNIQFFILIYCFNFSLNLLESDQVFKIILAYFTHAIRMRHAMRSKWFSVGWLNDGKHSAHVSAYIHKAFASVSLLQIVIADYIVFSSLSSKCRVRNTLVSLKYHTIGTVKYCIIQLAIHSNIPVLHVI